MQTTYNYSYAEPLTSCKTEIIKYEKLYNIPKGLLFAISQVESRSTAYALNDGINSYFYTDKQSFLNRANSLIVNQQLSFDVGCMQINYYWHGKYFNSVEEMADPKYNVQYAAGFLYGLYTELGSWQKAVRAYHSSNPNFSKHYSKKIAMAWLKIKSNVMSN